jgi:hypothetical protein
METPAGWQPGSPHAAVAGDDKPFLVPAEKLLLRSHPMDKTTKTQVSIALFVIGFAMIFVQDLKRLDSINLGFSWPFAIMFYLGLICMAAGYYLK